MRDVTRIDRIIDMFTLLWKNFPDLRFYQFIDFIYNSGLKFKLYDKNQDMFFIEDDKIEELLNILIEKYIKN